VTSHYTVDADIERDWAIITETASNLVLDVSPEPRGLVPVTAEHDKEVAVEDRQYEERQELDGRDDELVQTLAEEDKEMALEKSTKRDKTLATEVMLLGWSQSRQKRTKKWQRRTERRS